MFLNELKNLNKDEKMITNFIHISEKDVDEFLNMVKTIKITFYQLKHQCDILLARDTQAQNHSIVFVF